MSILTKICVVVLVALILVACPVFINQAVNVPNYRHAWEQEKARNAGLAQETRSVKVAHARVIMQRDRAVKRADEAVGDRLTQVEGLQGRLDAEQFKVEGLHTDIKRINSQLTQLRMNYEQNLQRRKLLSEQLDTARTKIDKVSAENRRANDLLKQIQAQTERLENVAKVLREQIVERDQRISQLEDEVASMGGTAAATADGGAVTTTDQISGTITTVEGNLAGINIGSANGVKPNMRLIIYRGPEFVAYIHVQEVDVGEAAGIIVDKRLEPMQGDKVVNALK